MTKHQLRLARPVSDLERSVAMYCRGLGFAQIDRFENHGGFDGVMLGSTDLHYHLEFTYCRKHPVTPSPTPEDLIVFYLPNLAQWQRSSLAMLAAGFSEVKPFNPYWAQHGRTFEDPDGYRVVLQHAQWSNP
jgi:catechol 2,3-dioxygenase-like lactoylglutathione lyase family enzyme